MKRGGLYNLPAHAGVIPILNVYKDEDDQPTRTRGGDPKKASVKIKARETYPHTRG